LLALAVAAPQPTFSRAMNSAPGSASTLANLPCHCGAAAIAGGTLNWSVCVNCVTGPASISTHRLCPLREMAILPSPSTLIRSSAWMFHSQRRGVPEARRS